MPFPAATLTHTPMHGPPIVGKPSVTVMIDNIFCWQMTDQHTCPMVNAPPPAGPGTPHGPGITQPPCSMVVLVDNLPQARMTDKIMEPGAVVPPMTMDPIMRGSITVMSD